MADQAPQKLQFKTTADLRAAAVKLHKKGDTKTARDLYRIYLARKPNDAPMWSNLGALFRADKNYAMAVICQRRTLHLDPKSDSVLNNAANAHFDAGEKEKALEFRRKALKSKPDDPKNWSSLGKYLRALGQHNQAKVELEKVLLVHPDDAELHIQLAFAHLALGDYPNGFAQFDWRWQGDEITLPKMDFPQWKGEDIHGKTILITPEQGFGDTILMARFLRGLADLGAKVRLNVKPPLCRVFKDLAGVEKFAITNDDIIGCDYWSPMMDLPRYLGTTLQNVPTPTALSIPDDAIERAKAATAPFKDDFKIGVLWSGSVSYRANHKRSFSHTQFLQLTDIVGAQMFSLYRGPLSEAFHANSTSCVIIDAASNDRDFADSATLINELDLVITMGSAIAHVAGSLGAKVWKLLHTKAYWLYEPFPDHTPWHPTMRVVRQDKSGDWDTVLQTLRTDIQELVRQKNG